MDGSDGWMDGHTFSPTTLIQKHLPSGAQCAKSWPEQSSMVEFLLWEFPALGFSTPANSTWFKFENFHSRIFPYWVWSFGHGGSLKNKKDIYSGNQHCGKSYGENSTNNLHSPNIKSHSIEPTRLFLAIVAKCQLTKWLKII